MVAATFLIRGMNGSQHRGRVASEKQITRNRIGFVFRATGRTIPIKMTLIKP
jgi:hypothetical protein